MLRKQNPRIFFYPDRDKITGQRTNKFWWINIEKNSMSHNEIVDLNDIKDLIRQVKNGELDWILNERS